MNINEEKLENTPAGGALVGKKDGQTIIHDKGTMSGYLVGKLHKDGGIKAVNKATGQPLEMQGGEVVITAPAVSDQTKREFEGKMMTNREILSAINEKGGGVSFADGGDIPAKIHTTDCEYKFGGKVVKDTDIAHSLGMNSTLKKGKQQFSSGDTTYDVDGIYNAIKKGKLRLKTKEIETFPMKYPVYDKNYAENHKIDFRKPNGITVRTESGEEVLIDGNHRMNDAYLKGRKTMKTYYIKDPKQIAKFAKKNKFELGGENKVGGHLSKNKSLKQIAEMHNVSLAHINEELAKGLEVEKEHFSDFKERTRVAKDHLVENPNYYTILAKAGLKMGGRVQRQELVEKSKKGDTPARDLNNYNDVMDLEADGAVGGDSGLAFANGGAFKGNSQDKIVKGVEVTNYNSGGLKEIAYNPNELLNIFKKFHKKIGFIDTHFFVTPFNNSGNKFKEIGVPIGGGDFQQIIPESISEHKLLKYIKGKYGGLDWSNFTHQTSNYAKGGVVYDTTKPKIEKVVIKATRFDASSPVYSGSRQNIVGKVANNVSELQQIVSDYIGSSPKEEYDWISFYVNDASKGKYYVDLNKDKKNTVKNVNPETLNSVNFKRVIDAKDYLVKNYDWTDFFEGASNKPARRGKTVDGVNVVYFDVDGKTRLIQDVRNPFQLYNFLKKLYNDGSRYVELQPSGYGIVEYPKSIPITNSAWQDILFVKTEEFAIEAIKYTLNLALFPKLDFTKFNNRSNTSASTSAYKADKEVQAVLIKYGKGNEYTALNGESLLSMMQDIWNSNGKTVRTIQIQPKGRIAQLSVLKIIDLVENPVNIEYEINPDKITLNELRDKLSKGEEWYNDLDWTSFFKENTPASSTSVSSTKKENVVTSVRLNFEKQDGTPYNKITANSGRELFKELEYAENNWLTAEDDFFRFQFIAYYTDSNGIGKSMSEQFNFGDKFFLPSNWSYDSFRRLVYYDWFGNKLDFSEFFHKTYIASSEREVSKVTLTYDTGVLLKEICYNGSELFEAYKLIEEMAEGGSLEVNVTLSGKDKSGQFFETQGTPQEVGQGGFEPSQIYSFEEFEEYFKSLYRGFDFNNFFGGITVPNSTTSASQAPVVKKPIVEKLYTQNGDSFSDIEKIRYYLDNRTIGQNEVYFNLIPQGGGDFIRVELEDSSSPLYYNRNAGIDNKYKKLDEIFQFNKAYENYNWDEFFSIYLNKKEVDTVEVIFNGNKTLCYNAVEFYDRLMEIENESQGLDVDVQINVLGRVQNVNSLFVEGQKIKIGEDYFQPSELGSVDNLKNVAENWFGKQVSFYNFFNTVNVSAQTPTSNQEVNSVAVIDANGTVYYFENVYKLQVGLIKIWDLFRQEKTFVNLTLLNNSTPLSQEVRLLLGKNDPNSSDLNEMSMIDFKYKIEELFPNVNLKYFFKFGDELNVTSVDLSYGSGVNATYYSNLKSGQILFDALATIEKTVKNWEDIKITANFKDNEGNDDSIQEEMVVVKQGMSSGRQDEFCPSVASSSTLIGGSPLELLKNFIEENIFQNNLDFDRFFEASALSSVQPFDFTDTKIDVENNPDLSLRVQKKAFEEGWEWENGGGKTLDYDDFNYLYFTKTSISYGNTKSSFTKSPKREITEEEIFGSQAPAFSGSTSSNPNNIEPYDAYRITLIWKDNSGKEIIDSMDIFNGVSGAFFISRLKEIEEQSQGKDVEVIIRAFANDDEGNQFEKNDYFTIGEIWFKPSTRTNEEIKSVVEEWIDGVNFDKYFADVIPLSGSQSSATQYKPIDLSQTKIWIGDNRDVSKQIQERAFELGWSWKNLALPTSPNYMFQPALYFHSDKDISYGDDKQLFDSNKDFKEITLEDLFAKIEPAQITQTPTVSGVSGSVKEINNLKEAVDVLEGIASQASQKYNTKKYEESLELLKQVKEEYALALSFTPESSFMYERIELMKKITEIQKEITRITELKNGGAYYILSKVIERLNRGENWKELGNGEIMVNEVPQQEIDTVIYTEKFKNWFGDWEQALITKEYDYVSKALTESGKPCVMYHGAKRIKFSYRQVSNGVVYLAENRSYAEWFSANESPYQKQGDYLTQCFVNLKNPIDLTPFGVEEVDLRDIIQYIDALYPLAKIYDVLPPNTAMAIMNNQLIGRNFRAWYIIRQFPELNKHIRDNTTYDGFIYYENNPSDMIRTESGEFVENVTKATAVFNSNQVKLVDAMLFDSSLDDWRFETGGKVN